MKITYLPYEKAHEVPADKLVTVDCYYHRGLNLAHRYNDRVPEAYRADTSTGSVLRWIEGNVPGPIEYVTCNHWDIDGFLAVSSVLDREQALTHRELLTAAAELGDFRTFDHKTALGLAALKLGCLLNEVERTEFCLPFGDLDDATIEYQVAVQKFEYFLPKFQQWLTNLDTCASLWKAEYDEVLNDLHFIDGGNVSIEEKHGISIVATPRPLHYYAVWSRTTGSGVATIVEGANYFEFEYKYESLVGRGDRIPERRDLQALALRLSALESDPNVHWVFDNIYEGGPILRPELIGFPISRELRYQNLRTRMAFEHLARTSIAANSIIEQLLAELEDKKNADLEARSAFEFEAKVS